ncbi:MAG: glycosyltransferase family 2 protein [Acidobacteria bacterium]|nr:glycosyltransferase family 2 protein [Acidobacteriota bacterium]
MPRLSIVIVTYNSKAYIGGCLDSLRRHPPASDHDTLVVDNASSDGTAAYVRVEWPSVRVTEAGGNLGFAKANNLGIRQTSGELVLLLNPDTVVVAGSLDQLTAALDARPDAAIAGPRLIDPEGHAELSCGAMMSPWAELRQKILVRGHARRIPFISAYVERLTRRAREVDWVSGACLLVRRADAEAAGLLDERFVVYTEDVDFCASVRAKGRTVLFVPQAEVVHARGRSAASARQATARAYRLSQLAFYEKHHPHWVPWLRLYLKLRGRLPDR